FPEKNRGIERKILFRMMPSTQNVLTLNRNLLLYADNFLSMLIKKLWFFTMLCLSTPSRRRYLSTAAIKG
ncbi:hypothetical protein MJM99_34480, partial [Salmonella enterica subsp. enterica serovar Kentucky]|nr:hypothetical protein [Salmonella enterica subsp. enterica serovar Kentucky]